MSAADVRPAWQLPLQWPVAAGTQPRHSSAAQHLLKAAIVFAVLAVTLLDRFGLRVTADFSIPPAMMALYSLAGMMILTGAAQLNAQGASAYLAAASVAGLSLMLNAAFAPPAYVSTASFMLLVTLYAPFAVALRPGANAPRLWRWTLDLYVAFALVVAAAGIAQFFAQFLLQPAWLFDYRPLIPAPLQASGGWNTVHSTGEWIKSNGFFLREPSIFSITMAFALLCELSLARRLWAMAVLATGLVLSYSGSGLLCLAAALLFPLGAGTALRLLAGTLVVATAYFLLGDVLHLSYTLERVGELSSERTSAYCRFVYPGAVALQQLDSSPWTALLGHGPGTMERMGATCSDGHQTAYAKVIFEYGLVGLLAFGALIVGALNRSAAPVRIRVAVALTWFLLGGNLLASEVLLFIYLLSAMWPQGTAARALARTPRMSAPREVAT